MKPNSPLLEIKFKSLVTNLTFSIFPKMDFWEMEKYIQGDSKVWIL